MKSGRIRLLIAYANAEEFSHITLDLVKPRRAQTPAICYVFVAPPALVLISALELNLWRTSVRVVLRKGDTGSNLDQA